MKTIDRSNLRTLAAPKGQACVSIYMPLHPSQPESQQDAIRFKNLVSRAEHLLLSQGMRRTDVDALLNEARELEANAMFWRTDGRKGLAALLERGALRTLRSFEAFDEFVTVGNQFHIGPLVHALSEPEQFLVLAVSANEVQLYRADAHALTPQSLPEGTPQSLDESTKGTEFDRGLQYHTSATHGLSGARVGIQHGHGSPKDDTKSLLAEYLRRVAQHLDSFLHSESLPLVLAAVKSTQPIFREVCRYPHLLPEGVITSPDAMDAAELHRRALEVVRPNLRPNLQAARERYRDLRTTDRIAHHLETILPAADQGRVDVLFVANGQHVWGSVDAKNEISAHPNEQPGDSDLLDLAVCKTIAAGGTAYVVEPNEVPSREPVAAILRW